MIMKQDLVKCPKCGGNLEIHLSLNVVNYNKAVCKNCMEYYYVNEHGWFFSRIPKKHV